MLHKLYNGSDQVDQEFLRFEDLSYFIEDGGLELSENLKKEPQNYKGKADLDTETSEDTFSNKNDFVYMDEANFPRHTFEFLVKHKLIDPQNSNLI